MSPAALELTVSTRSMAAIAGTNFFVGAPRNSGAYNFLNVNDATL